MEEIDRLNQIIEQQRVINAALQTRLFDIENALGITALEARVTDLENSMDLNDYVKIDDFNDTVRDAVADLTFTVEVS